MEYCILSAQIKTEVEPSENLLVPTKTITRYTSDATFGTFSNEKDAIEYATLLIADYPDIMILSGSPEAMELYESLWMGIGEECLHDYKTVALKILSGKADWTYGQDNYDQLRMSTDEHEEMQLEKPLVEGSPTVGSYLMDKSKLVLVDVSGSFYLFHPSTDIKYEDLTPEEQLSVTTPDTIGKAMICVSMGAMFDLWCLKKFDGDIIAAQAYATTLAVKETASMKIYHAKTVASDKARSLIKRFNTARIKYGFV